MTGTGFPGIHLILAPTFALSALVWGGLIYALSGREPRCLWLTLPTLPLSALVTLLIKRPLVVAAAQAGGFAPGLRPEAPFWYLAFLLLLAPVTEEAVKALPLLWPPAGARVTSCRDALVAGMALGLGFGLGEAVFLAYGVSLNSSYAEMPWYLFAGFLQERFLICLAHAILTAIVVSGWQRGRRSLLVGYLAAVGLHAMVNVGAMLYQLHLITEGASQVSLMAAVALLVVILGALLHARAAGERDEAEAGKANAVRAGTG